MTDESRYSEILAIAWRHDAFHWEIGDALVAEKSGPEVIAIIKRQEDCLWEIGDCLLKDIGTQPRTKVAAESFEAIAAMLVIAHGLEQYTSKYLRQLHRVALAFPKEKRLPVGILAHIRAGTPKSLRQCLANWRKDRGFDGGNPKPLHTHIPQFKRAMKRLAEFEAYGQQLLDEEERQQKEQQQRSESE